MARERDPNRDKAYELWKQHKGNITNREIANLLSTDEKKIAVWKQRDKWNVVQQTKKEKKNVVQQKKRKKNKSGNPNPQNQFTKRNKAAETHGFFSKYLPAETLEIMESLNERSPADLIWDQIQIQYAAIIRAQRIMFVRDQDDMTREIKKESENATEWETQFAWDKHATFMNAQSRAMSELRSLIKHFDEIAHAEDERRLKLQQMQLGIDKTKAEIDKLNGIDDESTVNGLDQLADALRKSASAIKGDE